MLLFIIYIFTYFSADSISMFEDREEEQMSDPDESEETVLMSLKGKQSWSQVRG